jgi:uncharacterized protein with FMN-binding domain
MALNVSRSATVLVLAISLVLSSMPGRAERAEGTGMPLPEDGVYYGKAPDHGGETLAVKVVIEKGRIKDISITGSKEDAYVFIASGLIPLILETQSLEEIDSVSGATETSQALIKAVNDALLK